MQALTKRKVQSGAAYAHLFPEAAGVIKTIKSNAAVGDTISFIRKVVPSTLHQTKKISAALNGGDLHNTCRNIWHFVYDHIAYKKDADGYEQVRSPARSWRDRKTGVDCDCYSTFISSILTNLRIPHRLRITKYAKDHFQHVYPIVPVGNNYIVLDCVTDRFNYEVPYTEKKDFSMDLQYLNGLDAMPYSSSEDQITGFDGDDEGIGELGLFGRKKRKKAAAAAAADAMANPDAVPGTGKKRKKKGFFRKLLNVANKVNPVTLALRNGVLAAMKLNVGKIASRLRWSYLSPNAAKAKGVDMARYGQLVATRQKLEDIFSNAGGNPKNMKNAILRGKGNKDKAVNGLLGLGSLSLDAGIEEMTIHTPLPQLLGPEIYYDENVRGMEGMEGFGELGEPVTLATVAAASSVIAAIAASLKKIGDIFKGKQSEGSADFSEDAAAAGESDAAAVQAAAPAAVANNPAAAEAAATFTADSSTSLSPSGSSAARTAAPSANSDDGSTDDSGSGSTKSSAGDEGKESFWKKNKSWLLPVCIGAGGLTIVAIGMKMMKPAATAAIPTRSRALHGTPVPYRRKATRRKPGRRRSRKKSVALL